MHTNKIIQRTNSNMKSLQRDYTISKLLFGLSSINLMLFLLLFILFIKTSLFGQTKDNLNEKNADINLLGCSVFLFIHFIFTCMKFAVRNHAVNVTEKLYETASDVTDNILKQPYKNNTCHLFAGSPAEILRLKEQAESYQQIIYAADIESGASNANKPKLL